MCYPKWSCWAHAYSGGGDVSQRSEWSFSRRRPRLRVGRSAAQAACRINRQLNHREGGRGPLRLRLLGVRSPRRQTPVARLRRRNESRLQTGGGSSTCLHLAAPSAARALAERPLSCRRPPRRGLRTHTQKFRRISRAHVTAASWRRSGGIKIACHPPCYGGSRLQDLARAPKPSRAPNRSR